MTSTGDVSIGGVITAPNQPCFRAIPSQDVIISSAGSFPALPYDSVVIDNASGYNTNTYENTIPVAGNWYFYWACGVVLHTNMVTTIRKNDQIFDRCVLDGSLAVRQLDTPAGKVISIIACEVGDIINVT